MVFEDDVERVDMGTYVLPPCVPVRRPSTCARIATRSSQLRRRHVRGNVQASDSRAEKITVGTSSSAGSTSRRTTSNTVTSTAASGTAKQDGQAAEQDPHRGHGDEDEER